MCLSTCTSCKQTNNWLGNNIPDERKKIKESGLWNIDHANNKNIISADDIKKLEGILNSM